MSPTSRSGCCGTSRAWSHAIVGPSSVARSRGGLAGDQTALARRLGVVDRELAEARQDVATARALLAEEVERVRSINDRRDRVIDGHVQFLAFARPRLGKRLQSLPARELDNAFEPDAIPACFARHDDPPAELAGMLAVVRRAPVAWLPAARGLLDLFDSSPAH